MPVVEELSLINIIPITTSPLASIVSLSADIVSPVAMFSVMGNNLIPFILNKIYQLTTGIVLAAVFAPLTRCKVGVYKKNEEFCLKGLVSCSITPEPVPPPFTGIKA